MSNAPALLIQGNTFDMTRSPVGLKHDRNEPCISLVGYDNRVVDNTFIYSTGFGVLVRGGTNDSYATAGNIVRGNTLTDTRATDGEPSIVLADSESRGCYDNRIKANTIRNQAAGQSGVILQSGPTGTNYATDNIIDCGSAVPFVVLTGQVVQSGNQIN